MGRLKKGLPYLFEEFESSSDHVRRLSNTAGSGFSIEEPMGLRPICSLGMTRKLEPEEAVVGEELESSRAGVADFLLPMPFNDLKPGIGIVGSGWREKK